MKEHDRSTKVLLALLIAGIWGLLLRPLVVPAPVAAQGAVGRTKGHRQYEVALRHENISYENSTLTPQEQKEFDALTAKKAPTSWENLRMMQLGRKLGPATYGIPQMQIGGEGNMFLTPPQVVQAIHLASKSGWEVHSISPVGSPSLFMVVLEK